MNKQMKKMNVFLYKLPFFSYKIVFLTVIKTNLNTAISYASGDILVYALFILH